MIFCILIALAFVAAFIVGIATGSTLRAPAPVTLNVRPRTVQVPGDRSLKAMDLSI